MKKPPIRSVAPLFLWALLSAITTSTASAAPVTITFEGTLHGVPQVTVTGTIRYERNHDVDTTDSGFPVDGSFTFTGCPDVYNIAYTITDNRVTPAKVTTQTQTGGNSFVANTDFDPVTFKKFDLTVVVGTTKNVFEFPINGTSANLQSPLPGCALFTNVGTVNASFYRTVGSTAPVQYDIKIKTCSP